MINWQIQLGIGTHQVALWDQVVLDYFQDHHPSLPVDKGPLCVHQVKLMIKSRPSCLQFNFQSKLQHNSLPEWTNMRYDFNPNCNLNGSCIWEHADRSRSACLDETLFNAHRPKILCSISTRLLYVTNYSIRTEKVLDFLANLKNNTIFSTVNVFTRLLPGTTVIGASLMPTLNPVGHLHKKKVGHLRRKNVGHLENYFTVTFRNYLVSIISSKLL